MASLTKCKDCGTEVSTKADACPTWGRARPGGGVSGTVVLATVLIGLALVAFILWRANDSGLL
jgi:hypothetical protein